MSLCYVYNINAIPPPPWKLHCDITEDIPRTPLANWNIPPLEKIMDPRMMLAGINRRYEYIGDYRYTHRCTRVTCSCYFDVSSMESFISCQSSKNCPRSTLLAEKNCARCLKLKYDTPGLYTLRGSRLSFPWKGGVDGRGISEFAGGREVRGIFHKLNLRNLHFPGSPTS